MVVFSIRVRISWAVAIGKVLLQLMDTRTFVRNHDGFKTGCAKHVPNTYYISLNAGSHRCTIIPRRLGWHRLEFVRNGLTTQGYLDHVLAFETNRSDRDVLGLITVWQERSDSLLDGFAIDDVRVIATE